MSIFYIVKKPNKINLEIVYYNKLKFIEEITNYTNSKYYTIKKKPYCKFLVENSALKTWAFNLEYDNNYPSYFSPIDILVDVLAYKTNNYIFIPFINDNVLSKSAFWLDTIIDLRDFRKIKNMNRKEALGYIYAKKLCKEKFNDFGKFIFFLLS